MSPPELEKLEKRGRYFSGKYQPSFAPLFQRVAAAPNNQRPR
jgi:hypothetical protein